MTDFVTVWVETQGSGGQFGGGTSTWARSVINCTHMSGGEIKTDQNGAEFVPRSTFFVGEEIALGVKVLKGKHTDTNPPATVETVRKVDTWTPLRHQKQDWALYTS